MMTVEFSGRYDDDRDATPAATISDEQWKTLQSRAVKANPERARRGSPARMRAARQGQATYRNRWWN